MKKLKHIITVNQFLNKKYLDYLFKQAKFLENKKKLPQGLKSLHFATLFYEPSTRTRLSFESAILKLGGTVVSTENAAEFSSAIKGESLEDTIRIVSGYVDAIILRHNTKGAAQLASSVSSVPIINAGDGIGEHPTQALLDLYTIKKELGHLDNLKIALVGDLLNGRTIHSLLPLLSIYKDIAIYLVSPKSLMLPQDLRDQLIKNKIEFKEFEQMEYILGKIDVLYMTRIQKERFKRFKSKSEYEKVKNSYVINSKTLEKLNKKAIIMHPLPRVNEIAPEVDKDKRAAYFRQAKNGLYIRMALLQNLSY